MGGDGSNPGSGGCGGGCELNDDGVCKHKSEGKTQFPVPASDGSADSLRIPQEVGAVPPGAPCDHQALNENVQPSNDYTVLPECFLTKAQDEKVLELARIKKPKIPLYVASMKKINGNLNNLPFCIPLQLVLNHFKDEITKATIKLEAPDGLYSVGASKHPDERVVLGSGWDSFVVSQHIQEEDLLVFRSTEKSRLEVLIIDPSGHEKNPSCPVTGNPSSHTQETSGDSIHSVDPPPPEVVDLSSSDDDNDIVREDTRESCRLQKRVTRSCAKTQKIASTSSPSTKSGYGAGKRQDDQAPVKLGGPYQRPYLLSWRAKLSLLERNKVEEKVQEIESDHPIFVKVMSKDNVDGVGSKTCELIFCVRYAEACLPAERDSQTLFLQLEGVEKPWETTFDVRTYDKQRRICRGWKKFSQDNALELGDICLFKLEDTNTSSLRMTVYIIRKSKVEQ